MQTVQCPHCHKTVEWSSDSAYRPFCSKRCRMIDLGAWASGDYAIPSQDASNEEEDPQDDE